MSETSLTEPVAVTLALDAEGGDNAPGEIVAGALEAASPSLHVLLVGRPEVIREHLPAAGSPFIEVVPSASVISFKEEPVAAVRAKPDSSIAIGAQTVAEGRSQGFISAGSTGAMVAAGLLIVKRISGVRRPSILTTLPGVEGPLVLLDAGANADCRPTHLLEFAFQGSVYARRIMGIPEPRVGLLNIGGEESKGNELAVEAHALLKESGLRFVGNVEGRDVLFNLADVVVTDGFTGNVALKLIEGTARSLFLRMRNEASRGLRPRLGAVLFRPALREIRNSLDPEEYGATHLLGVKGLVLICHGNSTRRAIANALRFGADGVRQGVVGGLTEEFARLAGPGASSE